MKIVFFGSSDFVTPILDVLKNNFDVVATIASANSDIDTGKLKKLNPDLFVVASFGKILTNQLIKIPKYGSINVHPSLLPKHRGASPVQSAILDGDKKTGVTIIKMDEKMDHGSILFQEEVQIKDDDTFEKLARRLFQIGADNIYQTIHQYIKEGLKPAPQDNSKASFTKLIKKIDGKIDLKSPPSKEKLNRMVRAYFPWPGVWTKWKMENGKWKILKILPNEKIQVEGKNPMSYKDFKNGYSEASEIFKKLQLA